MKQAGITLILLILLFVFPSNILAVSITINSFPSSISSQNDPFDVNVSISGASNATNYLRIDLYKESTTNYFGETNNGSIWYGGSDGLQYFPIQIQNSSAAATFQGRLGTFGSTEYSGPGIYKLKIRRYTSSGNQASNDLQTPADVNITFSTPTPVPTETSSPTSAPTATPTSTQAPTPTKTPTPKPTVKPTPTESPQVLGEETSMPTPIEPQPSPTNEPLVASDRKFPILPAVLILLGFGLVSFAGFSLFRKLKSEYNGGNEENT